MLQQLARGLIAAASISLMAGLAGCGSRAADDPNTIVFWDLNPGMNRTPYTQHMLAVFEERNPGIKVNYVQVPYNVSRTKVITAIVAGNPPDVSPVFAGWAAQLVGMDALEDLNPYFEAWEDKDDIAGFAVEFVRGIKEGMMCLMPAMTGSDALYYRKDWFERDGIAPPTNWDELAAAARHFTDRDNNRFGLAIRGGPGGNTYTFYFMMGALGLPMFDETGRCRLNDPAAVEGLQFYIDLHRVHRVTQPSGVTDGYRELVASFSSGSAAMYIHNNGSIGDQLRQVGGDKFMTAPLPRGPASYVTTRGAGGYVMYKASKKKELAWKLLAHLASREMQLYWFENTGSYPTSLSAQQDPICQDNPYIGAFFPEWADEAVVSTPPEYLPDYAAIDDEVIVPETQRALSGRQSAQETADKIAAALTESHRRWREGSN